MYTVTVIEYKIKGPYGTTYQTDKVGKREVPGTKPGMAFEYRFYDIVDGEPCNYSEWNKL